MPTTALHLNGVMGIPWTFDPKDPSTGPGITIINYERGVLTGVSRGIQRGTSMIIQHKKGAARYLSFPMISVNSPESFLTGLTVTDQAYYKDGAGAWTALSISDTVSEVAGIGVYEIDLSGAEMNHDQIIIKFSSPNAADMAVVIDCRTRLAEDLNDYDPTTDQVIVATNNDKTGYSITGTITTLDALDTAQDAQHAQTQADIAALPDAAGTADAVWDSLSANHVVAGSFGAYLDASITSRSTFDHTADFVTLADADVVADAVLSRNLSNVEVGLGEHTLGTIVLMGLESQASGNTLTIYRTNGSTQHITKTLTADPLADPVVGVS